MENKEYAAMIGGGKLGDFFHQLFVPAFLYHLDGTKTDLYMADIGDHFPRGLENTYEEIKSIIEQQDYINSFSIYKNQHVMTDLSRWRSSSLLYKCCWTDMLLNEFMYPVGYMKKPKNFQIMKYNSKREDLADCVLINRSHDDRRWSSDQSKHEEFLSEFPKEKRFFICNDVGQYNRYFYKDEVNLLKVDTMSEFFECINSCAKFTGNLSCPLAIAYCLKKEILCEFGNVDFVSYMNETNFYDNIGWYSNNGHQSSRKQNVQNSQEYDPQT